MNARNKGNSYERKICNEFKELGYVDCQTSRNESRKRDGEKVDLCNTGIWNVQCKAVEAGIPYHTLHGEMPKEEGKINTIFHKRGRKELVTMSKADFYKLLRRC